MRKSRINGYKQERLLSLFIAEATARTTADLVGVQRNTAAYYFHCLRLVIMEAVNQGSLFDGEVELIDKLFWRPETKARGVVVQQGKCRYWGY